jgi:teichuronic acid biosynthesis glycosyltransferase TuaC
MRILFSSYAYPNPWQPGLGTFNRTMIAALVETHAVRVVAPVAFPVRFGRAVSSREQVGVPGVPAEHPAYYYTPKLFRAQYDRFLWWSIRRTLRRTIAEFRPDVVLTYWAHPDGAVAIRAAHEAGLPAVLMVGGSDVLVLGRTGVRRAAILQTLQAADSVVAVSQDLARTMLVDGIDPRKLHVIGRGIDSRLFHPGNRSTARQLLGLAPDRPVILGVGRLVEVKDWPTWIDACGRLIEAGRNPQCVLVGSGPLAGQLQERIAQRGWSEHIRLLGPQSPEQLADWYRAANVTLLTSRSEGIPNVLLETLACGGSFVATHVGGIPEIADPYCDRLVPVGDVAALANALEDRLGASPAVLAERRFQPWSSRDAATRLTDVLTRVVSPEGSSMLNHQPSSLVLETV